MRRSTSQLTMHALPEVCLLWCTGDQPGRVDTHYCVCPPSWSITILLRPPKSISKHNKTPYKTLTESGAYRSKSIRFTRMEYRHSGMSYSADHRSRSFIRRHRLRHYRLRAPAARGRKQIIHNTARHYSNSIRGPAYTCEAICITPTINFGKYC